ncbi:UDP-glucose 4-epimerase [Linnemannia elongata]|nr:UDP-glucose 4-epimerase [Linnemannia elongata]
MSTKNSAETVLVTGGCGYVGSHTVLSLLESGYKVVVLDNLCNTTESGTTAATPEALKRIQTIVGTDKPIPFYPVDIIDRASLVKIFQAHPEISSVIHCAGLKAVGESGRRPLDYYNVNISGTLNLLQVMEDFDVRRMVFSSSATVYGDPPKIPIPETSPIIASMSTYGRTKVFLEHILQDLCAVKNYRWSALLLRYFNPVGAHSSGQIGESPFGTPANLTPFLAQVAVGNLEKLSVYGNDYPTKDGTCIRDYLHVVDCANGHVAALQKIEREEASNNYQCKAYNLGAGIGYTVLEVIRAFSKAVGRDLPYVIVPRRTGDVPNLTSDASLANKELNWKAERSLDDMCIDLWRWQSQNPRGYSSQK